MATAESANTKRRSELHNLIGLSYQLEGDNFKSQDSFKKALVLDPLNEFANINWGVQNFKANAKVLLSNDSRSTLNDFYKNFTNVRNF
jgi:lipoprotein NlpI